MLWRNEWLRAGTVFSPNRGATKMAILTGSPFFYALLPAASYAIFFCLFVVFASEAALKWAPLLSTFAIIISAISAFIAAIVSGNRAAAAQRDIARVKATYDALANKLWDKDYITARMLYVKASRDHEDFRKYVVGADQKYAEEASVSTALNNIANDNELTAIAIENNIIDEQFFKTWFKQSYINDRERMREYIDETRLRTQNDKLYVNFVVLAEKWANELRST